MNIEFLQNYALQKHNSLGVPAVCDSYIEISDRCELTSIIDYAESRKQAIFVLGEGTNLVLADNFPGLIVRVNIKGREVLEGTAEHIQVRIGAGENWHELVGWALERDFTGLENLALIPGNCGAAPVQNIGAYGVEISQYISAVEYVDLAKRTTVRLTNEQCLFGYRDSIFKHDLQDRALITHIELMLPKNAPTEHSYPAVSEYLSSQELGPSPKNIYHAVCAIRRGKLPDIKEIPNVGSFFKNPIISQSHYDELLKTYPQMPSYPQIDLDMPEIKEVKVPAAWLVDKLGWKGKSKSGVGVHKKQALVIVNPGHRSGERILSFAKLIVDDVEKTFDIRLEIEPRVLL